MKMTMKKRVLKYSDLGDINISGKIKRNRIQIKRLKTRYMRSKQRKLRSRLRKWDLKRKNLNTTLFQ